jgi:hypothetical protein
MRRVFKTGEEEGIIFLRLPCNARGNHSVDTWDQSVDFCDGLLGLSNVLSTEVVTCTKWNTTSIITVLKIIDE